MAQPVYRARLVEMDGTVITTFDEKMICESVVWTLNEAEEADLSFPKTAFGQLDVDVLVVLDGDGDPQLREMQIIDTANDDKLMCWGPIISLTGSGDDGSVHIKLAGVDWYLMRRFLDGTVTEYLDNPDFESVASGTVLDWLNYNSSAVDGSGIDGFISSNETERVFAGSNSVKLIGGGGAEFTADTFITQGASVDGGTLGRALVLSGWFYIEGTNYLGALEGRGLYVETIASGDVFVDNNFYAIDSATPTGKWVKAETTISIPASTTYTVNVRCYAGAVGTIFWDDIKLVQFDSFGFVDITGDEDTAADVGSLLCHLVDCVQNTDFGKSDVNISKNVTSIGQKTMQTFFFSDHVQFDQAIEGFLNDGGLAVTALQDYAILYDAGAGTRTFNNYAARGVDRTDPEGENFVQLVFSVVGADHFADRNCSTYRWTKDGANCITDETVLGDDSGPDREEAIERSADAVAGLTLQDVYQSPQNTEVKFLDPMALSRIASYSYPPLSLEFDVRPDAAVDLLGKLVPGDTILTTIEDGWITNVAAVKRIQQLKLNCITGVLTVKCF